MTAAPNTAELGRRVVRGVTWMVLLRVALRSFSVVSQLILVRLLTPADFGLVAGSSAAYAILDGLTETSMTLVLVQMREPRRQDYNTAWTLVVLRGAIVSAGLWLAAPLMAGYLHDSRVQGIVHVLAVVPLVQGFESVGLVRLQRDLQFGRIFFYQLATKIVGFATALPLAFITRDYWALVLGGAAAKLLGIPLSYAAGPHRPGLSLRGARAMLGFSKWLLLNNVLTIADNFMMPLTLGRIGGVREVGLFQVAYDLSALPASEVAAPIRRPMHAGYARVADDLPALRVQVLTGLGFLVMVIVPMSAGIAVTAPLVVHVALGEQWLAATPALAFGAIYTLFDALGHFTGGLFVVRNAQRPYVLIMAGCLALRLALVVPAAIWGGLSWAMAAMALTAVLNAYLWFSRLRRLLGLTWRMLASPTWRSFAAAGVMAGGVGAAQAAWPGGGRVTEWASLCALGAAIHAGTQLFLWRRQGCPPGPEAQLKSRFVKVFALRTARFPR